MEMATKRPDKLAEARRELERAGYVVKRKVNWVKHSFQVDPARLADLQRVVEEKGVFMKDALDEALFDWIGKNLDDPGDG